MAATIDLTTERLRRRTPSTQKLITRYGDGKTFCGKLNSAWRQPSHQARYPGHPSLRIRCETWDQERLLGPFAVRYDQQIGIARVSSLLPSDDLELNFVFWPRDHQWYCLDHHASLATVIAI